MRSNLVKTLMERDGITEKEANDLVEEAKEELYNRLSEGELPYDICQEFFGLEPDYVEDLID